MGDWIGEGGDITIAILEDETVPDGFIGPAVDGEGNGACAAVGDMDRGEILDIKAIVFGDKEAGCGVVGRETCGLWRSSCSGVSG